MALAYLRLINRSGDTCRFWKDTGTSGFFELVIGRAIREQGAVRFVDDIQKRTGIRKAPSMNPLQTGSEITVDGSYFDKDNRFIQLFSYQSADGKGPSFSEVVEVYPRLEAPKESTELPDLNIPKFFSMSLSYQPPAQVARELTEQKMSEAMFFAALMPMLTKILPVAGNLLGGLSGGGGAAGGILGKLLPMLSGLLGSGGAAPATGGGGTAQPNIAELLKPETITAIKGLIDQFTQAAPKAGAKSLAAADTPAATVSPALLQLSPVIAPILEKMISPQAIAAIGADPQKLYAAIADGIAHLPEKDIQTIRKLLLQTSPADYVKAKSETVYARPMFWQALLSLLTPEMVNAVGGQTTNIMKTAQDGILNLKKEQQQFVKDLIPKGDINQPVIKDMINAISQYNLMTHQPAAAAAQSIGAFTNALCQVIPALEQSMSADDPAAEVQQETSEMVDKIRNQFMKLQEDLQKKIMRSMKEKIEEHTDRISVNALSLQFSEHKRYESGLAIFRNRPQRKKDRYAKAATQAMSAMLPVAFAAELKRTALAMKGKGQKPVSRRSPDPAVALMLEKIEEARAAKHNTIPFKHDGRFEIEVAGAKTVSVNGVPKVLYVADKGIRLAVSIQDTQKKIGQIPRCIIQVQFKQEKGNEILLDKKFRMTRLTTGAVTELAFDTQELKALPVNTDLLVCITLAWKDREGRVKGTRKCHSLCITDGFVFGGLQGVVKTGIPLNNITEHREFWHKVWESSNPADRQKTHLDCKYYLQFRHELERNNQLPTKSLKKKGKEVSASEYETQDDFIKIKTGLQVSPHTLNKLVPSVAAGKPGLNEKQLKALANRELNRIMDSSGLVRLEFKTRRGETTSLWVYPEVDLVELGFKKPHSINAYGNVLDLEEEKAFFIKPSALHFIGTKS